MMTITKRKEVKSKFKLPRKRKKMTKNQLSPLSKVE